MKLIDFKKNKKKFDPVTHWYMILSVFLVFVVLIILYSVYSLFYIKREILIIEKETRNAVMNSTSTEDVDKSIDSKNFLDNINSLNKNIENFEKKEIEYNRLVKSAVSATVIAASTASTTVATSTN